MKLKLLFLSTTIYTPARKPERNQESETVCSTFKIAVVLTIECKFQFHDNKDCFSFANLNFNNINLILLKNF